MIFMEDHNTATFTSKKYYDLDAYHLRKLEKQMKKGFKKVLDSEHVVFNDEEQPRHVLFRFSCEEDYTRFFSHRVLFIVGFPMRIFKWTTNFSPKEEALIVHCNEVECEQLVWVPKRVGQSVPFNTYIWQRGTIPIWWGAELKLTAAEAEIYVSDRDPYRGSSEYYQRLSQRYDARNLDVAVGGNHIMCLDNNFVLLSFK
ncbi:hypothetical protein OROGR_009115 [Orobanche gracilis]